MQLHIAGRVSQCECRFTRAGVPVLEIELHDASGQTACLKHAYPDASNASGYAARALASRLRGQHVELDMVNPRFKARRLEADVPVIHTAPPERKDLQ